MQHITPNLKRWDYSDIPGGNTWEKIKGHAHMVEGDHHLRNWTPNLGPVLLLRHDAVVIILGNGSAAFLWKLHCHWLKCLRLCQIAAVRQGAVQGASASFGKWEPVINNLTRSKFVTACFLSSQVHALHNEFIWGLGWNTVPIYQRWRNMAHVSKCLLSLMNCNGSDRAEYQLATHSIYQWKCQRLHEWKRSNILSNCPID